MPEATQWKLVAGVAAVVPHVFKTLVTLATNATLIHNDDTTMRILDLRKTDSDSAKQIDPQRKAVFSSNLLAELADPTVALFSNGWQHARKKLTALLRQRDEALAPPIQMGDALSRNICAEFTTILAHCLAHGPPRVCECDPELSPRRPPHARTTKAGTCSKRCARSTASTPGPRRRK